MVSFILIVFNIVGNLGTGVRVSRHVIVLAFLCAYGVLAPLLQSDLPLGSLCSFSCWRAASRKHYFFSPSFCLYFGDPEGISEHCKVILSYQ